MKKTFLILQILICVMISIMAIIQIKNFYRICQMMRKLNEVQINIEFIDERLNMLEFFKIPANRRGN